MKTEIQKATDEYFIRVRRLRLTARPADVAHEELSEALTRVKAQLGGTKSGDAALYAMAALADELWLWDDPLELQFFGTNSRKNELYDRLEKLLAGPSKQRDNADTVWVYLQSLTFGFRGQPPAPKTPAQYATRCLEYLQRAWGDFKELAPRGHIPRQKDIEDSRRRGPIGLLLAVCLCALVAAGGSLALIGTLQTSGKRAAEWHDELTARDSRVR